jgi:hypothetical protein
MGCLAERGYWRETTQQVSAVIAGALRIEGKEAIEAGDQGGLLAAVEQDDQLAELLIGLDEIPAGSPGICAGFHCEGGRL